MANKLTDLSVGGTDYDTFTLSSSGYGVTSAINLAGTAYCISNTFAVTDTSVYKVITFITKNTGEVPLVQIINNAGGASVTGAAVTMVEGVSVNTLTATATCTGQMKLTQTGAANWKSSDIYLFKV